MSDRLAEGATGRHARTVTSYQRLEEWPPVPDHLKVPRPAFDPDGQGDLVPPNAADVIHAAQVQELYIDAETGEPVVRDKKLTTLPDVVARDQEAAR